MCGVQLSVLQTFYEILSNRSIQQSEQHRFVVAFLTKVVRHLFQKLKKSPLLFVDLLFWKTKQDCHCITADYVNQDLRKTLSKTRKEKISRNSIQDRRALLIDNLGDDDEDVNQRPPESSLHRMHNRLKPSSFVFSLFPILNSGLDFILHFSWVLIFCEISNLVSSLHTQIHRLYVPVVDDASSQFMKQPCGIPHDFTCHLKLLVCILHPPSVRTMFPPILETVIEVSKSNAC